MAKKITFYQTFGGSVTVPDDRVDEFEKALSENDLDIEYWHDVMKTFVGSHYDAHLVEASSC